MKKEEVRMSKTKSFYSLLVFIAVLLIGTLVACNPPGGNGGGNGGGNNPLIGTWVYGGSTDFRVTFTESRLIFENDPEPLNGSTSFNCDYTYTATTYTTSNCSDPEANNMGSYSINDNRLTLDENNISFAKIVPGGGTGEKKFIGTWVNGMGVTITVTETNLTFSDSSGILTYDYAYNSTHVTYYNGRIGSSMRSSDNIAGGGTVTYLVEGNMLTLVAEGNTEEDIYTKQ